MKKISYIICLTAILCSCNNELPIENVQELQTPKSKEDSEILSFKNSEEFLSTIENFDLDNPILTRASSSFVSAENIYALLPFTYCMKKKYLIFLVLSFCLFSSCSTMLEIITGNYKCAYPNCNERATENSVYCPYHKPYYLK